MKSIIDNKSVLLRARLANAMSVGGLLLLLASLLLPYLRRGFELTASFLLLIGLFLAMVGIYLANRWVRKPRPEAVLDSELKSLSDAYCLYHYRHKAADHILLTPYSVIVLETVNLEGRFIYKKGRWQEYMKFGRALRYIVEEHLGNPVKAALSAQTYLQRQISNKVENGDAVPVKAVVVFTHPRCILELEETEIPVVKAAQLKRTISEKGAKMPTELYEKVKAFLDRP